MKCDLSEVSLKYLSKRNPYHKRLASFRQLLVVVSRATSELRAAKEAKRKTTNTNRSLGSRLNVI